MDLNYKIYILPEVTHNDDTEQSININDCLNIIDVWLEDASKSERTYFNLR